MHTLAAGLPGELRSAGSTLHKDVDNAHPQAFGMPANALATYLQNNPAWEIVTTDRNERVQVLAKYPDRDLLQSGWLLGEEVIARKAAMVSVEHGQGRVVMIGFRAQHRAQTHGTFKLVFNALIGGASPTAADRVP